MSRRCTATNKHGNPCRSWALKDQRFCLAHADQQTKASRGFGGVQEGGGRPPKPRVVDVLRERIEADIDKWFAVLTEARDAERAVVVGNGPQAYLEMVPDAGTRLAAFREAFDRVYGKAKQTTELTGADGGPLEVAAPLDARERAVKAAALLAAAGQLEVPAAVNGNGSNGNGNGNGRH
jgi:hypothetical protein